MKPSVILSLLVAILLLAVPMAYVTAHDEDERELESDLNDRFAAEKGAEGSVEWEAIEGGIEISEVEAEGLRPGHSYEIKVTISVGFPSFDPFMIVTSGPIVADSDGEVEVEDLEISDLMPGNYRVDIFVTHAHSTVPAGFGAVGKLVASVLGRDPLLACQPAFNLDVEEDDEDDEAALQLNLLDAFIAGITEIEFPEDEDFFVTHGWGTAPWSTEDQVAFRSDATRFDLLVDGVLQVSIETFTVDLVADSATKLFRTDFDDDDAEDTHVFTAIFLLDAQFFGGNLGDEVVIAVFDITVHFVDFDDDDDD